MDVVTSPNLRCRDMPKLVADVEVARYDMMFLSVGIQDVLDFASVETWTNDVGRILKLLRSTVASVSPLFVIGVPSVSRILRVEHHLARQLDRRAAEFNALLHALCSQRDATFFVPFEPGREAVRGRHRSSETYRGWAELITAHVSPELRSLRHRARSVQREDERQAALDRLQILDTPREQSFDAITASARRFVGTQAAGISFIDHERQWFKSSSGIDMTELPRAVGLCNFTIHTCDGFVVENATLDPRFANNELVITAGLRSYAGVPIRDTHGNAVGALCVFDNTPRKFTETQMTYLRDLANLAEKQLPAAA